MDSSSQNKSAGVIYILTNPSFPEYVKIGYADDIGKRLKQLNNTECTPFAFRVYATYDVPCRLSDIKIHTIIDKLNPNLRAIDRYNGRERVREFYAMSPEDAYSILEAIAEIHGFEDRLKLITPNPEEVEEEKKAEEIQEEKKERLAPFSFSICQIPIGSKLEFWNKSTEKSGVECTVVDDKLVEYDNKTWSLTALAKQLSNASGSIAGPRYFKYNGEWLNDIRKRLNV